MELVIKILLPLALAFIMFSLGIGLVVADFRRVLSRPTGFALGALGQIIILPLVAMAVIAVFGLGALEGGALAVSVVILALSPGGVTSNLMTKLGKGDVALSLTLTAIITLLAIITMPVLLGFFIGFYMGEAAPAFSAIATALQMFAIVAVPAGIGLAVRHFAAEWAIGNEGLISRIATGLFVVLVLGALIDQWSTFTANLAVLGPALIVLNLIMLLVGFGLSRLAGMGSATTTAISIETGIQNATVGIAVAGLIAGQATGNEVLSVFALASGVYGITMYAVCLPFVFWRRTREA